MLGIKVWRRLLGVCDRTVIERVEFDEEADAVGPRAVETAWQAEVREVWASSSGL